MSRPLLGRVLPGAGRGMYARALAASCWPPWAARVPDHAAPDAGSHALHGKACMRILAESRMCTKQRRKEHAQLSAPCAAFRHRRHELPQPQNQAMYKHPLLATASRMTESSFNHEATSRALCGEPTMRNSFLWP